MKRILIEFVQKDGTAYEVYFDENAYFAGENELVIVEDDVTLDMIPDEVYEIVTARIFKEAEELRTERLQTKNGAEQITITDLYVMREARTDDEDEEKPEVKVVFVPDGSVTEIWPDLMEAAVLQPAGE